MLRENRHHERRTDLRNGLAAAQRYAPLGGRSIAKWDTLAHHTLHVDLEDAEDGDATNVVGSLTNTQRDRLIAHTRQDVATAVFGAHYAYQEARAARIFSWLSFLLNIVMLGILIYAFIF